MLNRLTAASVAPSVVSSAPEEAHGLDLREAIGFLWRQWIFICSIVGAVLFVTIIYLYSLTPRYTASALVLLEMQQERAGKQDAILSEVNLDSEMVESQLAIIKSTVFLQRVVEKLGLASDPEFGSPVSHTEPSLFAKIRSAFMGGSAASTSPDQESEADSARTMAAVLALRNSITAARAGQGYVLSISVTSTDPARAAKLANAVADGYVVEKLDARFDAAKRASAWLSDRLTDIREQLHQSEEAVAQFRADNKLVQTGGSLTLNQQQLADLNAKLVDARSDVAQKKARMDLLQSMLEKGASVQTVSDLPTTSQLTALRAQEAALGQKVSDLTTHYDNSYPLVVNARSELRDVQRQVAVEQQKLGLNVQNDYELAKAKADALGAEFSSSNGPARY